MSEQLKLVITPRRAGLVRGIDNVVEALVRLQAPARPASRMHRTRPPLNIALVIDRSSSMQGRPLTEACKAAAHVVNRLAGEDHCAVIIYDHEASTLVPLTSATDKLTFQAALRQVHPRGNTNLHGGWLEGASSLAASVADSKVSRVIVLSDGEANAGIVDPDGICQHVERMAAAGVTTSTLGLGTNFNEALMTDMARAGGGRAHYGHTADDLLGPVSEELDLLDETSARRARTQISPAADVGIEVLNASRRPGSTAHPMPDVAWESEAVIAIRLTLPARMTHEETLFELVSAQATFLDADGAETRVEAEPLVLPVLDAAEWSQLSTEETVGRRFVEIEAATLQEAARHAVRAGNWQQAERIIRRMRPLAADNPWLQAILEESETLLHHREQERFSKSARYAAEALSHRIAGINEGAGLSGEDAKRAFLARKLSQGRTRKPD